MKNKTILITLRTCEFIIVANKLWAFVLVKMAQEMTEADQIKTVITYRFFKISYRRLWLETTVNTHIFMYAVREMPPSIYKFDDDDNRRVAIYLEITRMLSDITLYVACIFFYSLRSSLCSTISCLNYALMTACMTSHLGLSGHQK